MRSGVNSSMCDFNWSGSWNDGYSVMNGLGNVNHDCGGNCQGSCDCVGDESW